MNFLCRLVVSGLTRTNTFKQLPALNQNTIRPVAGGRNKKQRFEN